MAAIACDFHFISSRIFAKLAAILIARSYLALARGVLAFSSDICHSEFLSI